MDVYDSSCMVYGLFYIHEESEETLPKDEMCALNYIEIMALQLIKYLRELWLTKTSSAGVFILSGTLLFALSFLCWVVVVPAEETLGELKEDELEDGDDGGLWVGAETWVKKPTGCMLSLTVVLECATQ